MQRLPKEQLHHQVEELLKLVTTLKGMVSMHSAFDNTDIREPGDRIPEPERVRMLSRDHLRTGRKAGNRQRQVGTLEVTNACLN
jgi:hypothetical protein